MPVRLRPRAPSTIGRFVDRTGKQDCITQRVVRVDVHIKGQYHYMEVCVGGDYSSLAANSRISIVWGARESNRILGVCGAARIDCSMPKQQRSIPTAQSRRL